MPANRLALWAIRLSLRSSAVEKVAMIVVLNSFLLLKNL